MTLGRGLTAATAAAVCSTIKDREMKVRAIPGTRIGNTATGTIAYSPPEGRELIIEKLGEWERFVHADDGMDALVRLAVAHYRFEAIHPFSDGNGRTGLVTAGLLQDLKIGRDRLFINREFLRLLVRAESTA